jgi:molybdopterin-binding protein
MASVKLDIGGGNKITALISVDSVKALKLQKGDKAAAIIKATEVIIGK